MRSKFIIAYLFKGCLNQSCFLNNRLDNTKTPALAPTKTSKKGLKKLGLKGLKAIKKKAAKPARITEEDIIVAMFLQIT